MRSIPEPRPRSARPVPCPFDAPSPYLRRCRRLSSGDAPASQPSCLRLFQTSNCRSGSALRVRPFAAVRKQLLWPRLTAAFPRTLGTRLGGSPGVRRVTFLPPTRRIYSLPVAIGLQRPVPPRPPPAASYAVCVPRAGSPPTTAFPLHPCHAVAVRLGVPTTRVSGGTSHPPGHFPIGFRLTVIRRPNRRRRAMPGAQKKPAPTSVQALEAR